MTLRNVLEDFGAAPTISQTFGGGPRIAEADLEAEKLEAFEQGYRAGWDDAIKAQADEKTRIASDFGQNLQDLSFTYHEAYSRVLNAMGPLLQEMVETLLPEMSRATLAGHIIEQLEEHAKSAGVLGVTILVAPENLSSVEPLMAKDYGFPITLDADDTLGEGQADIRFDESEQQIDLTDTVKAMRDAIEAFAYENHRKVANG